MNDKKERERERISGVVSRGSLFGNVEDQKLGNRKYFYPIYTQDYRPNDRT
jgi:hypothetical protein